MMRKAFITIIIIAAALAGLSACYSPVNVEDGNGSGGGASAETGAFAFSLNLYGPEARTRAAPRTAVDIGTELAAMVIDVRLTGPGGDVKTAAVNGGGTLDIELDPGVWVITARAVSDRPSGYTAAFPARMLRAVGEESVTITAGNITPVTVIMYTATEVSDWAQLSEAAARARTDGKREYVFVTQNISVPASSAPVTVPANTDILLSSAAGTGTQKIERAGITAGALFRVAGGSLTLGEDPARPSGGLGLTIDGGGASCSGDYPLIEVSGGRLLMYDGTTLRNNVRTSTALTNGGGGVFVAGGTFTMSGGEISRNTAGGGIGLGGGVFVYGGTFTLNSGTISRNTASNSGGGVFVAGGTFTLNSGTISGNTASSAAAGGVYVDSGTFTMNGGTISGNTASSAAAGGVYVYDGTFTMSGGEISGNTASRGNGGGVYVYDGTFTLSGGTISGNTASSASNASGGGVYMRRGTHTLSGGTISDNTASGGSSASGGGVFVGYGATFTMSGGEISRNTASGAAIGISIASGGGVFVGDGTFTMSDGKISGNGSDIGGGVYINIGSSGGNSEFTMSGGEISGNTANASGGGVQLLGSSASYAKFTMSGGTISGNRAPTGAGVHTNTDCIFAKRGGTITGDNTDSTNSPSAAYSDYGPRTRTTTAGPDVRLYVDFTGAGSFIDPDDGVDTTSNWM